MEPQRDTFGVVIACHAADYPLALGCAASVRHFMGHVPLAVIADGDFDLAAMEMRWGAKVIRRENVQNQFLRENSFGWGLTKMIALWESPWAHFLYLDADTVLWSDPRTRMSYAATDMIMDLPRQHYTDAQTGTYFFDPDQLVRLFSDFAWRNRPFANSGTFFARRGAIPLADYERMLAIHNAHPGFFQCGEQGILNLLVFQAADAGRLHLRQTPLQTLVPDHPVAELRARFTIRRGGPRGGQSEAPVIHWCGQKPWLVSGAAFHAPMTFFRAQTEPRACLWLGDALQALARNRWARGVQRRWQRVMRPR